MKGPHWPGGRLSGGLLRPGGGGEGRGGAGEGGSERGPVCLGLALRSACNPVGPNEMKKLAQEIMIFVIDWVR